jgi:hypothetical protein
MPIIVFRYFASSIITGATIPIFSGQILWVIYDTTFIKQHFHSAWFAYDRALLFQGKIGAEFRFRATVTKPLDGFR